MKIFKVKMSRLVDNFFTDPTLIGLDLKCENTVSFTWVSNCIEFKPYRISAELFVDGFSNRKSYSGVVSGLATVEKLWNSPGQRLGDTTVGYISKGRKSEGRNQKAEKSEGRKLKARKIKRHQQSTLLVPFLGSDICATYPHAVQLRRPSTHDRCQG